jgi:hypothetical protein
MPLALSRLGMKRVVRNTDTNMFIRSDGEETKSIDMARSFISYDDAVAFCKANHLTKVELVVQADDDTQFTVAVPAKRLASAY